MRFLKGWFKDTLPLAPINSLSILRLDGDMYESTMDALKYLYPKLSKGGFILIDDWGVLKGCRQAVMDYRTQITYTKKLKPLTGRVCIGEKKTDFMITIRMNEFNKCFRTSSN